MVSYLVSLDSFYYSVVGHKNTSWGIKMSIYGNGSPVKFFRGQFTAMEYYLFIYLIALQVNAATVQSKIDTSVFMAKPITNMKKLEQVSTLL